MKKLGFLLLTLTLLGTVFAARDASTNTRMDRVRSDVEKSRSLRTETLLSGKTLGLAPAEYSEKWFNELKGFEFVKQPVPVLAQVLATLSQKEVFVSRAVSARDLTLRLGKESKDSMLSQITEELRLQKIEVQSVGTKILLLHDPSN